MFDDTLKPLAAYLVDLLGGGIIITLDDARDLLRERIDSLQA